MNKIIPYREYDIKFSFYLGKYSTIHYKLEVRELGVEVIELTIEDLISEFQEVMKRFENHNNETI